MEKNKIITRNVRLDPTLDAALRAIADYEDRTISKIIYRFLWREVINFALENKDFVLADTLRETIGQSDIYKKYSDLEIL